MNLTKNGVRNAIVDELRGSYPLITVEQVEDVEKWMAEGGYTAKGSDGSRPGCVMPPHGVVGHFIHGTLLSVWPKYEGLPE